MSTKQMMYAAKHGRRVLFKFEQEMGYIVGMDDYHWLVAVPTGRADQPVEVTLIHKGAQVVRISRYLLSEEPDYVQAAVKGIGKRFFDLCPEDPDVTPQSPASNN